MDWFRGLLLVVLAALCAAPAAARAEPAGSRAIHYSCIAYADLATSIATVAADPSRWKCGKIRPDLHPEKAILRFDIPPGAKVPHAFVTRRSALSHLEFMVVDADGATRSSALPYADVEPTQLDYMIRAPLPPTSATTRTVYVAIALPTQRIMLEQALVAPGGPGENPNSLPGMLLVAVICGMLLMPLLFNLIFYRVLRERFVLWHSAMCVTILLQVVVSSGVFMQFIEVSPLVVSALAVLSFSGFTACAAMFAWAYLEPGKLDPRLRALLPWAAGWAMLAGIGHAFFPFTLRPIQSDLYYSAFAPVLLLFIVGLGDALRRGSRAAKFALVGWVPLMLLGAVRLASSLLPIGPATDAMPLFYIAILCDAVATTMGVADRFMALKRERDRAEAQAREAEDISERDALTGLLNRRAIEPRFAQLHRDGFETLALLDLDHFKLVNDTFGHAVGDEVLIAAATALAPDGDTLAMRLGGEEFLLLLRGKDALRRAERRRQAITARVSAEVAGLDRLVTASMGAVSIPASTMPDALFADLYARADKLLYQAKQAGRNRGMSEKVTLFADHRKERRRADRRRAPRAA